MRGKGIASKFAVALAEYLHNVFKAKALFTVVTGVYMIPSLLKEGFKVKFTTYYDEYEYNGVKVFKDIPANKYYIDSRPAAYLISYEFEDS